MSQAALPVPQRVARWWDERLKLSPLLSWSQHKVVPVHKHSFWYYIGGIVLVYLLMQVLTGMLLMVYYVPDVKSAYTSILMINGQVDFGWFIRSLHSWGSNLAILALFLHMFSAYLMKAYRSPREITWWSGLAMLGLIMGLGFTGYLLPWDEVSFFATKIGVDIAGKLPLIGEPLALLLRGGPSISGATLSRFFTLHVIVLPLMLAGLMVLHLVLVQVHGTSEPRFFRNKPPQQRQYEKFFPTFALKDLMGWLLVINLMALLVAIFPWGLGPEAKPFQPAPEGIKPEWYFLAPYQVLKLMPPHIGPIEGELFGSFLMALVGLFLFIVPLIDRGDSRRMSLLCHWGGLGIIVGMVVFTVWGYLS